MSVRRSITFCDMWYRSPFLSFIDIVLVVSRTKLLPATTVFCIPPPHASYLTADSYLQAFLHQMEVKFHIYLYEEDTKGSRVHLSKDG